MLALFAFLSIAFAASPASALIPWGNRDQDSFDILNGCPPGGDCTLMAIIADPPVVGVTGLSLSFDYDPAHWTFRADLSGPLCEFSVGGSCPPATAALGTRPIGAYTGLTAGALLPGSTLVMSNDTVLGIVTINYTLADPLLFGADVTEDRNFFAFFFERDTPFDPSTTMVTYYADSGGHEFNQLAASCSNSLNTSCGSKTPVGGFTFSRSVPEPLAWITMVIGFLTIGAALRTRPRMSVGRRI